MKILFCSNTFENIQNGPSKFARAVLSINQMVFDKDVEIRILTEDISDDSPLISDQRVFKIKIKLNSFTRPWGFIYRMVPYYSALKKVQAIYPYDVVVFNNAITGIWSAFFLKVPVVGMINDYTSMSYGFHNFNWTREWFRRMLFRLFEQVAVKVEKAIIVNSKYVRQKTSETYGSEDRIHVLYKGIPMNTAPLRQTQFFESPIGVLFVKADFVLGGLYILAKALARLKKYNFELFVVGPSIKFRKEIEGNIQATNIELKFVGPLPEDSVVELMQTCNLFIVPSYHEALGVANMEALLHGIHVISSDQGGIPEVLNYGQNGWMVPPDNPEQLANAIEFVISNPELRAKKRVDGYEFVRSHFDIKKTLQEFVKILSVFS